MTFVANTLCKRLFILSGNMLTYHILTFFKNKEACSLFYEHVPRKLNMLSYVRVHGKLTLTLVDSMASFLYVTVFFLKLLSVLLIRGKRTENFQVISSADGTDTRATEMTRHSTKINALVMWREWRGALQNFSGFVIFRQNINGRISRAQSIHTSKLKFYISIRFRKGTN